MQQHDCVVDGQGQLQDGADRKGDEGDVREKEVGTHIDQNGYREYNQKR